MGPNSKGLVQSSLSPSSHLALTSAVSSPRPCMTPRRSVAALRLEMTAAFGTLQVSQIMTTKYAHALVDLQVDQMPANVNTIDSVNKKK